MLPRFSELFSKIGELESQGRSFVCITLVHTRGHAPQDEGARALADIEGLIYGTVGGGKVEAKAIATAQEFFKSENNTSLVTWNLQRDVGMSCGGEVTFFFEKHTHTPWTIAVFGAGHVAQALIRVLLTLQCKILCIDYRKDWLEKLPTSPKLKIHTASDSAAMVEAVSELPENAYLMLMTQGHAVDFPILKRVLETRTPSYLGVIGSEVKGMKLRKELEEVGISREKTAQFFCPMGLPFGSNAPEEIALSMCAQILQIRDQQVVGS
jgi:xanthine dehydrogenase accessory factor